MQDQKVPAFAGLLREAGFSWASADEICAALDRLNRPGCGSDDVAAALFTWRRKFGTARLAGARREAAKLLRGDGTDRGFDVDAMIPPEVDDIQGQLILFETADEKRRFAVEWAWQDRKPR